jgi:hypothetical protein
MHIDDSHDNDSATDGPSRPSAESTPGVPAQATAARNDPAHDAPLYRIETVEQLKDRARIKWLIRKVLPKNAFIVLYGEPGDGKTFAALDIALRFSTGLAWVVFEPR